MNEATRKQREHLRAVRVQNRYGEWVPAIPEPYYSLKKHCICGKKFWTKRRYKEHYALEHILSF